MSKSFSGGGLRPSRGTPGTQPEIWELLILFSCSAGQRAFEHPDLKHGVFFNYIIEELKGAADFYRDNDITLTELELYSTKKVQRFVRKELAERQVPERRGEARGLISLGRRGN
jgi:uncharacterized caspase-like protein